MLAILLNSHDAFTHIIQYRFKLTDFIIDCLL